MVDWDTTFQKRCFMILYKACDEYTCSFYGIILQIMILSFLDLEMASML